MAGMNGSTDGAARIKGVILFRKREWPLWNPKRKACIGSLEPEEVRRLRIESALRGGIASLAAIVVAIRFASASITRCRSANLVEVRSNHRLPPVSSMRRAQQRRIWHTVCRRVNVTRASR